MSYNQSKLCIQVAAIGICFIALLKRKLKKNVPLTTASQSQMLHSALALLPSTA